MFGSIFFFWCLRIGYVDFFIKKKKGCKYVFDKNYLLIIILFFKIKVILMILVYLIDFVLLEYLYL